MPKPTKTELKKYQDTLKRQLASLKGDVVDWPFGACPMCLEAAEEAKAVKTARKKTSKKADAWIPKARLEYIPWARYCVTHQESEERNQETA